MRFFSLGLFALATATALPAQYAFHFEFDQAGVLPNATTGVGVGNPTSTPTTSFFSTACGVLEQRTTVDPTYGVFFYSGVFAGYPTVGPPMPIQPTFAEARFTFLGGTGGSGTIPDSTTVLGILPGANVQLVVNCVTGVIGLSHASGVLWTTPPGGSGIPHTYRLESSISGGNTYGKLIIDGVPTLGPVLMATTTNNGWYFGDAAGSHSISTKIDWEYVSIGQATPGVGQANSHRAALFVNRSNTTHIGQMGLNGPFATTAPASSTVTLEWNGPANQPFMLFAGQQAPAFFNFGCSGSLDLGAGLSTVFNPFAPYSGLLFFLDGCGYSKQTFKVPSLLPSTPLMNVQGLVFQPSGCPYVLTAAHYVTS